MDRVEIAATEMSPSVRLEVQGEMEFVGRSMMEDASTFYLPVHEWLRTYMADPSEEIVLRFDLTYFNSSSAKQLLKILMTIDDSELQAKVVWSYPEKNDVLYDRGAELAIMVDIPFEFDPK